jgi:hypothetical protein
LLKAGKKDKKGPLNGPDTGAEWSKYFLVDTPFKSELIVDSLFFTHKMVAGKFAP